MAIHEETVVSNSGEAPCLPGVQRTHGVLVNAPVVAERHPLPKQLTREEFEREWALLAVDSENLPSLTDQDLTREALYSDHD